MLTEKQRQKLNKNLHYGYTKRILEILEKNGATNHEGQPYSGASIRNVVNGRENLEIETALLEYYEEIETKKEDAKKAAHKTLKTA